ncbi:Abhydrolase_3 domain-containing protein [Psidium guajava]|nr:Abhydrolase_3 domain-containing protein [Psidium guajava]
MGLQRRQRLCPHELRVALARLAWASRGRLTLRLPSPTTSSKASSCLIRARAATLIDILPQPSRLVTTLLAWPRQPHLGELRVALVGFAGRPPSPDLVDETRAALDSYREASVGRPLLSWARRALSLPRRGPC